MTSTRMRLATALGVAGAVALSIPTAEAGSGRNALGFGIAAGALAVGAAVASQSTYYHGGYYGRPYAYRGAYAYQPYGYDNYYSAPAYYGGPGVYFGGRYRNRNGEIPGTNYNPNQG